MTKPHAQWTCDNQPEIEALLAEFEISIERSGDVLRLRGPGGLELEVKPGDGLIVDGDKVGYVPVPKEVRKPMSEMIISKCDQCGKPVKIYQEILDATDTLGVVCGQQCYDARVASIELLSTGTMQ